MEIMIQKNIKNILLFISLFLLIILFSNCASSKQELREVSKSNKVSKNNSTIIHSIRLVKSTPDSIAIYSFYRILKKDTLKLENINLSYKDSLIKKIRIPNIAYRAGVKGNVIIEFNLDSAGLAKNIRILSGIGAEVENSVVKAISKYKFNFWRNTIKENSSILLIAYFEFNPPFKKYPPIQSKIK